MMRQVVTVGWEMVVVRAPTAAVAVAVAVAAAAVAAAVVANSLVPLVGKWQVLEGKVHGGKEVAVRAPCSRRV